MRWRAFSAHIVDLAEALGVQLVVSLGALLGDVPAHPPGGDHRARLRRRRCSSASACSRSELRGPDGDRRRAAQRRAPTPGCPAASLWAAVPHYVAAATNPKAALALLRRVEGLIGVSVDVSELEAAAADYERQVGLAVQSDPDIQAFVERLEQAADSEEHELAPRSVPSGDILAREFQRFLRQRGPESK